MRSEVGVWWKQAKADIATAEANLRERRYYASVFFCQQAVEKAGQRKSKIVFVCLWVKFVM